MTQGLGSHSIPYFSYKCIVSGIYMVSGVGILYPISGFIVCHENQRSVYIESPDAAFKSLPGLPQDLSPGTCPIIPRVIDM